LLPALKKGCALPDFEIVSPQEWLQRLASSEQNPEKNPSIKLIDFWQSKYAASSQSQNQADEKRGAGLTFESGRTIQDSPSLALVKDPVTAGLIQRYVEAWMKRWTGQ
jgi:hypothetical protein